METERVSVRQQAGWGRRFARGLAHAGLGFAAASLFAVAVLRWVPPPATSVMLLDWLAEPRRGFPDHDWVPLAAVAVELGVAVIAAEDQRFPEHGGFDFVEIRNALERAEGGGKLRGASTISQQVAKNLFLWNGRSLWRKGLEAWFTLLIETLWDKRRILEIYLNVAQFGDHVYGAEAASRRFFGKPARDLSAAQAARLAAVLPNPVRYRADAPSPYVRGRARWIQGQMTALGGAALLKRLE